jgi:anti-sigma B factor antagonist
MEIRHRFGVAILKIVGRLVTGSAPSLRTSVNELVAKRRGAVLINMAAVTDMDAHGIGELVCSLLTVERHDSKIALIAPSACVRQLLAVTRLNTIFAIYDSEAEALVRIRPMAVAVALRGTVSSSARPPYV